MRIALILLALWAAPALAAPPTPIKTQALSELAIHPQHVALTQAVSPAG